NDTYCLCYLTTAANLKKNNNSIAEMEKNVLFKNKFLKNIFETSTMLFKAPITISQISFSKKTQVQNHVLLCGDAAGMITPLCGNGMSIALHSSKLAAITINQFLQNKITREGMEAKYTNDWKLVFEKRLRAGRIMQRLFGRIWVTNIFISIMKKLPFFATPIIRQTYGQPF
ncbi:MAG: pyridine nucleotide-disulfide oxidoreductase, partial [Ferruginibacter sp.]|nr:pyridine nucleotide-disulfide oxidoreductase [Ferruginibacter sp.]